ncbi:MAG: hypothetical protein AABW50_03725 [Nanoarchaeota archaeon]
MPKITINLDDQERKILEKRAKKNLMTLQEQIEDIIRRSAVNYKLGKNYGEVEPDDRLVGIFSRSKKGRKKIV